jgi:hypothetical protein
MINARLHSLAILLIGECLGFIAALITAALLHCLSWNVNCIAIVSGLIWIGSVRRGKRDWESTKRISAYGELQWHDSIKFLRRHVLLFAAALLGAAVGYAAIAMLFKVVCLSAAGQRAVQEADVRLAGDAFEGFPPDSPGAVGLLRYAAALLCAVAGAKLASIPREDWSFLRGRKLLTRSEAQVVADKRRSPGDPCFELGGVRVPDETAVTNICVVGAPGSGKTKILNGLIQYAVSTIGNGRDHRAIMSDPKRDLIPLLHGMQVRCRIFNLNPFDLRGVSWDVGKDCDSVATALQLSANLVPEDEGPNRFFSDAGRELVVGVLLSLMRFSLGRWTLRDLLLIVRNQAILRQVLSRHGETAPLCHYFDEERTYQNIRSSLASKINRFSPIAACWDRASESLALSDWVNSESILVLGYDPSIRIAMQTVNRAIYQRLSEVLLGQSQSTSRRTWHIFDEAQEFGRFDSLPSVATFGRGAGNRIIIGFQTIEGMRNVYGREIANELTGLCATKAFLRSDDPETASWAAKIIGDCEVLESRRTAQRNNQKNGSFSESTTQRVSVLTSELLNLPATNRRNGLTGYYVSPFTGAFRSTLSAEEVDALSKPPATKYAGFAPRPAEHQVLRPFDDDDLRRLGLNR